MNPRCLPTIPPGTSWRFTPCAWMNGFVAEASPRARWRTTSPDGSSTTTLDAKTTTTTTTTTTPTKVRRVRLLCKENLIPFYERYGGFALEGASAVEHGAETWFDMVLDLA